MQTDLHLAKIHCPPSVLMPGTTRQQDLIFRSPQVSSELLDPSGKGTALAMAAEVMRAMMVDGRILIFLVVAAVDVEAELRRK